MKLARIMIIWLAFLLPIVFPTPSSAVAMHSHPDEKYAVAMVLTRFVHAQADYDQSVIEALLSSDYAEISPLGQVDTRSDVIGFYSKEIAEQAAVAKTSQMAELSDIIIEVIKDLSLVRAKEVVVAEKDGVQHSIAFRVSFILQRSTNGWLIKAAQYTPIREPKVK